MTYNSPPRDLDDLHGPGAEEAMAMADRDNEILDQALENLKARGEDIDEEQVAFEVLKIERENPLITGSQIDALNDQLQQEREAKKRAREAATHWMSVARKQKREKDKLLDILKHVDVFISNGIELGYIRKPEPGSPEHETAKKVREIVWER